MKKSVWSAYFQELSPEDMVLEFEKAGYNYSELSFEHGDMLISRAEDIVKTGREFREFAAEHGMTFPQGHIPLSLRIFQNPEDLETMKRYLDLYNAIGIKYCVIHCDKFLGQELTTEERIEKNLIVLRELDEYVQGTELVICLENLNVFPITVDILLTMLKELNSEHFAICLDTGHLHMNGGDLVDFVRRAGKNIKALHIADNQGETDQHMMPCGKGTIDFITLFKEIKKIGYDGLYNLEIPGESEGVPIEVRRIKLKYINDLMDTLNILSEE